ncbi:MAG: hypothetical protein ACFFDW_06410 [Candidatus Thorarchaeota archaeon]
MLEHLKELREKIKKNPNDDILKEQFARDLFNTAIDFSEQGDSETAINLVNEIENLAKENTTNENILLYYGQTVLNTLPIYLGRTTQTEIKTRINMLREIAIQSNNKKMTDILSMALVNAVYDFSLSNQTPSIHEFSLELIDLSRNNPKSLKIQTACAKGMMNAIMYFIQKDDIQAAEKYYEYLLKVIENNPKEEMVDSKKLIDLKEFFQHSN